MNWEGKSALIGSTGFVGGFLQREAPFTDLYNSKNIEQIEGQTYDFIVCAGAPAAKWIANQNPREDLENIRRLLGSLEKARPAKVILISTVDVYPRPLDVDEDTAITLETHSVHHAYGKNRYLLEEFLRDRFKTHVLRLPALFGSGLKKNAIYDLLHKNNVGQIDSEAEFQFYFLGHLWDDIKKTEGRDIPLLNVACEPLKMRVIAKECFGLDFNNPLSQSPAKYDFKSKYAEQWPHGSSRGYLYPKDLVLDELRNFVATEIARTGAQGIAR